ncbi:hypothetical protein A9X05_09195 [Mycobacterium sp. E3298]|nr:hypothetical protein A9X05_09195 [Mycobacterium sp. E3298]
MKTSENNVIYNLDLFGQVPTGKVKVFSNKNGEKQTLEIDWDDKDNLPEGFTPFGFNAVRTSFEKDEKGKAIQKNYFNYDGVEVIKESLSEGDSIWINGTFNVNTFMSNGEEKSTVKYTIGSIGLLKEPVDFSAEGFKEVASFEQEFVVIHTDIDKANKKVFVTGRIINFNKTWNDIMFVVDGNEFETLAANVAKKFKFGDVVTVQGKIRNGTVLEEIKEQPSAFDWGGEAPEGQGKKFNRNRISELQITNVTEFKQKVYKEDDFFKSADPFEQTKGSSSSSDPFAEQPSEDPFA